MTTKQTVIVLLLLAAGVVVFGFLASWTTPITLMTQVEAEVPATTYADEGQYLVITIDYPQALKKVRDQIEAEMSAMAATFKTNANVEALTPEDIRIQSLGGDRRYTLDAEFKKTEGSGYISYAYTAYDM